MQSVAPIVPEYDAPLVALQPAFVCSAIWFSVIPLIPSMMSISPPAGQFSPFVQKLGQI